MATTAEVAGAIVYLGSPEAEFASGTGLDFKGITPTHLTTITDTGSSP